MCRERLQDNEDFFEDLRAQRYRPVVERALRRWRGKVARRKSQARFVRNAIVQFALKLYFKISSQVKKMRRKNTFSSSTISSNRKRAAN